MRITGVIVSSHPHAAYVASALSPDSDGFMTVEILYGSVVAKVDGESLRSVIATVDDYLMNLSVSERLC